MNSGQPQILGNGAVFANPPPRNMADDAGARVAPMQVDNVAAPIRQVQVQANNGIEDNVTWNIAVDVKGTEVLYGEEVKLTQVFDAEELRILKEECGFSGILEKMLVDSSDETDGEDGHEADDEDSDSETLTGLSVCDENEMIQDAMENQRR